MSLTRKDAAALRTRFLSAIGPDTPLHRILDLIPEISFFAKDTSFRLICASRSFIERLGFRDELQLTGRNDFDLFPASLAEKFRADDAEVFRTGRAKHNIVELFFNDQGIPDWYVTSKEPLRDARGKIIGLMGITHSYTERRAQLHPGREIDRALDHIRQHFRTGLTVKELAAAVHLSPRQLHRKFHDTFRLSPQAFIIKLRIQAACESLQKEETPISQIASDLGFCDQSNFAQLFQRHVGLTPLKYRQRFQLRPD